MKNAYKFLQLHMLFMQPLMKAAALPAAMRKHQHQVLSRAAHLWEHAIGVQAIAALSIDSNAVQADYSHIWGSRQRQLEGIVSRADALVRCWCCAAADPSTPGQISDAGRQGSACSPCTCLPECSCRDVEPMHHKLCCF